MEDEDITQELFLDSNSKDKLMSHDSDQDKTNKTNSGLTIHSLNLVHL